MQFDFIPIMNLDYDDNFVCFNILKQISGMICITQMKYPGCLICKKKQINKKERLTFYG